MWNRRMVNARILSPSRPTPCSTIRRAPASSSTSAATAPSSTLSNVTAISEQARPASSATFPVMSHHSLFQSGHFRYQLPDQPLRRRLVDDQFMHKFPQQDRADDIRLVR